MQEGIKPIFVFDGKPPELKYRERQRRKEIKIEAEKKYQEAVAKEDIEGMKKFAARTSRITPEIVESAKKLLTLLGLPVVQAPSEGEAEAAYLTQTGTAWPPSV